MSSAPTCSHRAQTVDWQNKGCLARLDVCGVLSADAPDGKYSSRHPDREWAMMRPSTGFVLPPTSWSVLVVAPAGDDVRPITSTFEGTNVRIAEARDFAAAKGLLARNPPDVLITDLQLAEFNGLHLVLRGKAVRPQMAALVMSRVDDPVLRADAHRLGATFVVKPFTRLELLAATVRTLCRREDDLAPLWPPFERRAGERRTGLHSPDVCNRRTTERRAAVLTRAAMLAP